MSKPFYYITIYLSIYHGLNLLIIPYFIDISDGEWMHTLSAQMTSLSQALLSTQNQTNYKLEELKTLLKRNGILRQH